MPTKKIILTSAVCIILAGLGWQLQRPLQHQELITFDNQSQHDMLLHLNIRQPLTGKVDYPATGFAREEFLAKTSRLQGTMVDGGLTQDANGDLILNLQVRDLFDYFLSAVGDVSPEDAIAEIRAYAYSHVDEKAAAQTMALLETYLHFKADVAALMEQSIPPEAQRDESQVLANLRYGLNQISALRGQYFTADARDAFFADEEAYATFTIDSLSIQQSDLSNTEKANLLAAAEAKLPEHLRNVRESMLNAVERSAEQQALLQAGDESALYQNLSEEYDPQTVDTIMAEYASDAAFQQRYQAYSAAVSQSDGSEASRQALQASYFKDDELNKVATFDSINKLKSLNQSELASGE